jgi:hypothetical protein
VVPRSIPIALAMIALHFCGGRRADAVSNPADPPKQTARHPGPNQKATSRKDQPCANAEQSSVGLLNRSARRTYTTHLCDQRCLGALLSQHRCSLSLNVQSENVDAAWALASAGQREGACSIRGRKGTTHAPEAANQAASLTSIFLGWARAGFGIVIFRTPFDIVA